MTRFCDRLRHTRARVEQAARRYGRDPASVSILAVGKTHPPEALRALAACGQRAFGENYAQELVEKARALADLGLQWHFIGPLQSNKTRPIAETAHWVHSIDRLKTAQRLSEQRPADLPPLQVCLQVNISGEASKSGVSPHELAGLAAALSRLPRLDLRGLMAIPAPAEDEARQRAAFAAVRAAFEDLRARGHDLDVLSMGMSGDLEAAIAEGATLVRVGTALFGERARQTPP